MELLLLPYDSAQGASLLGRLIAELQSGRWTRFRAGVAFARVSGNVEELRTALVGFATAGGTICLTFGADAFAPEAEGSDLEAIRVLVEALADFPSARISLYHEVGRTFHPKVYLFDAESAAAALLFVGSSNWSRGGLFENVEATLVVPLDLASTDQRGIYEKLAAAFDDFWVAHA